MNVTTTQLPVLITSIYILSFLTSCRSVNSEASATKGQQGCLTGYSDQAYYEDIVDHAVWRVNVNSDIRYKGFDKVNSYFATIRYHIQKFQENPIQKGDLEDFGSPRRIAIRTHLRAHGPYSGGYARVKNQMLQARLVDDPAFQRVLDFQGEYTNSYVVVALNPYEPSERLILTRFFAHAVDQGKIELLHTSPDQMSTAMKVVRKTYDQIVAMKDSAESKSRVLELIGQFHWWFAQATPFVRGSSAIGKMHVASLLKYHGIQEISLEDILHFSKRQNIDLDVWALTHYDPLSYGQLFAEALKGRYQVPISY